MTSFDGCSTIIEVSRFIMVYDYVICMLMSYGSQDNPVNYNVAPTEEQDDHNVALTEEQDDNHEV